MTHAFSTLPLHDLMRVLIYFIIIVVSQMCEIQILDRSLLEVICTLLL